MLFVADRCWDVGGLGTLIFGIWLALNLDQYDFFDGWILLALALWAVAGAAGIRLGLAFDGDEPPPSNRINPLYAVMAISVTALLVVMIYKPGV